ncbi:MAG: hypothetical protein ACK4NS_02610 [Saprospiraceae bacterium]
MAQFQWIYLDDSGGRHQVGIYHGDRSGHLLIHCNRRVVQIDFSVREDRVYSFFIEDELCEISLKREKNGLFSYDFQVNKKADTPRNRERKAETRRNNRLLAISVVGGLILLGSFVAVLQAYGRVQRQKQIIVKNSINSRITPDNIRQLNLFGRDAAAVVVMERDPEFGRVGRYRFATAQGDSLTAFFKAPDVGEAMTPTGFPLTDGDQFNVFFLPDDPQVHRLEFFRPTEFTIQRYLYYAVEAGAEADPEGGYARSKCRAEALLKTAGWPALAHAIYQNEAPEANRQHNQRTYLKLIRKPAIRKALDDACQ